MKKLKKTHFTNFWSSMVEESIILKKCDGFVAEECDTCIGLLLGPTFSLQRLRLTAIEMEI